MTVSTNPINSQGVFIRTSRNFPQEAQPLAVEMNRSYVDIASHLNQKIIGIFPTQKSSATGESWYLSGPSRNQSLRQVYSITSTSAIPHGINLNDIFQFSRCWGQFTDSTNWYGLIFGSNVAIAGQISFYIDPTNINFLVGAGAPSLTKGLLILEWLSNVSDRTNP